MTEFFQHMINMLILGSTYALLGIGLTLIFGIMRVVNFAHGELYAFGAYFVYFIAVLLGFNFFLSLLVMIGAIIVMQNTEQYVWGGVAKSVSTPFPETPLVIGPFSVSWLRLFVFFAALALIAAAYFLINRTKLGMAMRATFQDRDTASLMGVNIQAIYMATFAIGSSLAAAAGALLGPVYVISPQMGNIASLKAFAVVILGGLGSIGGATVGGFILAFAEEMGAGYISSGYRH